MENTEIRYNVLDITSIKAFYMIKGGYKNGCKDVYFTRIKGGYTGLENDVYDMEEQMRKQIEQGMICYSRIDSLDKQLSAHDIEFYTKCFQDWKNSNYNEINIKASKDNMLLKSLISKSCNKVLGELKKIDGNVNESIEKNFLIKLLFWTDKVFEKLEFKWDINKNIKIVALNIEKKHEYLFYYFLTLLGIDVLLIQNKCDIPEKLSNLSLSKMISVGDYSEVNIKSFERNISETDGKYENSAPIKMSMSSFRRPDRDNINNKNQLSTGQRKNSQHTDTNTVNSRNTGLNTSNSNKINTNKVNLSQNERNVRTEKTFEELALLASSVVMIAIHDKDGEVIGSGSGIMIAKNGYILTNNHVAAGGCYYSIRIEDDDNVYETDEVIKYNPMLDLAVIRIDRKLNPLKVYNGKEKLVRGQKVVAIGSPLGLFNSVSDGIISGFRVFDNVDMIQFTAPTSHGSSGGAVLNMYGEVIGISTAGIDKGQNINLAMGYECINNFVRGFINY